MGSKISEFIPTCEWKYEQDLLVLEVDVPGFKKDRLKVEYKECGRRLKISGERPGEGWVSKVFLVPGKCKAGEIKAVYRRDRHVLRIVMPRKTSGSSPVDSNIPNPNPESNLPPSQAEGEARRNGTKIAINVAAVVAVFAVIGVFTFFIICKAM